MRNKKCSKPLKYSYTQFNFYGDFCKAQLKKNTELPLISIKRRVVGNTVRICLEAPTPPHLPPPPLPPPRPLPLVIGQSTCRQENTSGYKPPGYKPFYCLYWNEIYFTTFWSLQKRANSNSLGWFWSALLCSLFWNAFFILSISPSEYKFPHL